MKIVCLLLLCTCACSKPTSKDWETVVVQVGQFDLDGSHCRLFEVSQKPGGSAAWNVQQRFNLCDPPLAGMLPGSKPGSGKEPNVP